MKMKWDILWHDEEMRAFNLTCEIDLMRVLQSGFWERRLSDEADLVFQQSAKNSCLVEGGVTSLPPVAMAITTMLGTYPKMLINKFEVETKHGVL